MSKWWKCDLQLATPAWQFQMPSEPQFDLTSDAGKDAFALHYMKKLNDQKVDVVVLADHNTGDWIDRMVKAGREKGVVVFPGCEITSSSGADGVHLIIVGDCDKSSRDFDLLLSSRLGFEDLESRYFRQGNKEIPAPSSKTVVQILDELPDGYLAIAPHALGQNGIASEKSVMGALRWKALHHEKLAAIDVGEDGGGKRDGFNHRFRTRDLGDFPCLRHLAFVSTSDAYSLDALGDRFSWIRMGEPNLEGLRQAFLDYRARIICSDDPRLNEYVDGNPNNSRHGWIEDLELRGTLGNSNLPIKLHFHPGLNVIIGGRGSGKSTIVAALRQLYAGNSSLPDRIKEESEAFSSAVFADATLASSHRVEASQERQSVEWQLPTGSLTTVGDSSYGTTFKVRVVNQKELFERVSSHPSDPSAASRSFLAMLDEGLGLLRREPVPPDSWWHQYDEARARWRAATAEFRKLDQGVQQLPQVEGEINELEKQVRAFDAEDARARRTANSKRIEEDAELRSLRASIDKRVSDLEMLLPASDDSEESTDEPVVAVPVAEVFDRARAGLDDILRRFVDGIRHLAERTKEEVDQWATSKTYVDWSATFEASQRDNDAYMQELLQRGIDPGSYKSLQEKLANKQTLQRALTQSVLEMRSVAIEVNEAWGQCEALLAERRETRSELLQVVAERSATLRFSLLPEQDVEGWVSRFRELLNLRSDAYLDDVPELARWIWGQPSAELRKERSGLWRHALGTGNFASLSGSESAGIRTGFAKRIESLDEALRLRVAVDVPDDLVVIEFLKDGGSAKNPADWQKITKGSPGQRTAAMLGFILTHGVEPLVLDQPEDDLDTEWVTKLVVEQLRRSRWKRQLIIVTHNANIPVNGDADRVIVLENKDSALRVRESDNGQHFGPIECRHVREDIQNIMEGGIAAFARREKRYKAELVL